MPCFIDVSTSSCLFGHLLALIATVFVTSCVYFLCLFDCLVACVLTHVLVERARLCGVVAFAFTTYTYR